MAKKKTDDVQADLFPVTPAIVGLGVTQFKVSDGKITAVFEGAANVNDIARLDNPCWQNAGAAWLLSLCGDDVDAALIAVKNAYYDSLKANRPSPDQEIHVNDVVLM